MLPENENIEASKGQEPQSKQRKVILFGVGGLVLLCILLWAFDIFHLDLDFYAGGYSIENVVVTDELGADGRPLNQTSKSTFDPTTRIDAGVYTSGVNGTVGMRWFHEDTLLFEFFERTRDNYIGTYLEGSSRTPLPGGDYRVEVHVGRDSDPIKTVYFTVKEFELAIDNIPPTPIGHIDIENSQNLEIPFAFDEIWEIDGVEWHINEVKIVFLRDVELFVVVVETDLDPLNLPEAEIEEIAKPIAIYSIENGYWDQARQIKIDGKTYPLTEPLAITLINPDNPGQGNRVRFDIDGLMQSP